MRIVFMGTPQAAVPSLKKILEAGHEVCAVWTQPDRPAGRGNKLHAPPVKEFALENGLEVHQPTKIKTPEALELFRSHKAELAVVVAYGRILPQTFLESFPHGAINVHFSLLPKYRGAAPVNWAIVMGETKTGVTTMRMDAGLDTGDMLLVREAEIGPDENAPDVMERLSHVGADLLAETLDKLEELQRIKQVDENATFAPIMNKEDGLIDWQMSAVDINNRIRGFQPFPRSFSFYDGKRVVFWKAAIVSEVSGDAGRVLEAKGDRLVISCGNGTALAVLEAQLEGKQRMSVRDFLNGAKLEEGGRFA